jgi:hypothetical protein
MTLLVLTVGSLLLAVVMTGVAWRVSREEHRRAQARIAALAAEIHDEPLPVATPVTGSSDMFAARPRGSARRYGTVVAAGLFVCATIGALAVISSRGTQAVVNPSNRSSPPTLSNPLELIALGHDRDGDRLTVRGVVRNPNPAELDHVTAIVLVFGRDGAFLTSGRADVVSPALGPGAETTFVVTVPGAADVSRYRVSFRTEDRVVPHVDRRSST